MQPSPDGLAQAFIIGEEFIGKDSVAMVLGDNIFHGQGLVKRLKAAAAKEKGATVFGYYVDDPERFGIVEFDENGRLQFKTEALEADARYDEIGSGLKIKQLQQDKKELLESLEMYYKVFFLGDIPEEELKKTSGSED